MLNHALKYLSLGLSVIPLHPNGKEPLYNWKEYQSHHATEQEIKQWWTAVPNANIGIVTGKISNLVIIDLDGPEGLVSAQSLGLKSSLISLTGNGKHLWYRLSTTNVPNAVRTYPGIDIRGDGGYVVAPPSVHESGKRYRWLKEIKSVSLLDPFPTILTDTIQPKGTSTVGKEESRNKWSARPDGWIAKVLQEMKNGNIDVTLFTICSRLRADGYSPDDARILLAPHAARVGAEAGHLDDKIKNVWDRYEARSARSTETTPWFNASNDGLVIHSPTNPDSIQQFEQSRIMEDRGSESLRTGYPKLDRMLSGGLKSSRLFTIAARTGVGKTNWLLGAVRQLCRAGKTVLLFSTEMPYQEIWTRYLATLANAEEFKSHKFYVCDSFAPNIEKVEEAINAVKPDVFMFDHINHISEEQKELGAFMQGLNFLRRKYECAGIVTAQLNRSADWVDLKTGENVTPRMSMIKGSGTIEQASSRVLLLSETRVTPEGTEIVGNLDKNDNGSKGLLHFMLQSNPYQMVEL